MSFGFSPGDIVLFTGFANKVIQALKDEGGSQVEYQLAHRQCEGFLSEMKELQRLDLSGLPESFRDRIAFYSEGVEQVVEEFQKTIKNYEKSMGETSKR